MLFRSPRTFSDVASDHGNYVAIEYLVSTGTLEGYDDPAAAGQVRTFQPDRTINRAEIMKTLVAGQGIDPDPEKYNGCFPDVEDAWYARYVCYASEQGWVDGYPDGLFRPGRTVNKVESIKMSVNAMGLRDQLQSEVTEKLYDDTDSSEWYAPYLQVAKRFNLLEVASGDFRPGDGMRRRRIAENIFRTLVVRESGAERYDRERRDTFLRRKKLETLIHKTETGAVEGVYPPEVKREELKITMEASNYRFFPDLIAVSPGQRVTINFSGVEGEHRFVFKRVDLDEPIFDGKVITFLAPEKPGEYRFFCSVRLHRFLGMKGVLVVK